MSAWCTCIKRFQSDNIIIVGEVKDLRQAFKSAAVLVRPLRAGAGLQNKILEAYKKEVESPAISTKEVEA